MARVYFSLGSNQGDRLNSLVKATKLIDSLVGRIIQFSPVVESEPWGFDSETNFYNLVLMAETELSPHQLLDKTLGIEKSLGRTRSGTAYSSRNIDIDILFYNEEHIDEDNLEIPHPLLHKRKFVLQPLASFAPDLMHPVFQLSVSGLLCLVEDTSSISVVVEKAEFIKLLKTINPD